MCVFHKTIVEEKVEKMKFTPQMRRQAKRVLGEDGYQKLLAWNRLGLIGDTPEDLQFVHQAIKNAY